MKIRTGYSFRAAVGHLDEVINRLHQIGWSVAPISDRMSTFAFTRWRKLAERHGLRPIFGVELGVVEALGEKQARIDYWTFFAIDDIAAINRLIKLATNNPGKEPTITYKEAVTAKGVIKIAGERCLLDNIKPEKDLYIALQPSIPRGLFTEANKRGFKFIATSDNYYPGPNDEEFYRVTLGNRANAQTYARHILSDEEWLVEMDGRLGTALPAGAMKRALKNRNAVIKQCQADLRKAEMFHPERQASLREMCLIGAANKECDLSNDTYATRLDYELKLIKEKGFEDYFYIIADLVQWAKQRMIVGPARGSSCGSLVCYLLDITTIDPIPYGLIFERFIDINRTDLPDIDIDFSDERRELVFKYAEEKFGIERVARLGSVGQLKLKSALKRTADSLELPYWQTDKIAAVAEKRAQGDERPVIASAFETEDGKAFLSVNPEAKIAARIENHPSHAGQHAAGIVITKEPIINYVAVDSRTNAAMCDKKDAEELNLLKIDALGLKQLSILENVLRRIGHPDRSGLLETIPLDDPIAFDVFNSGHLAGVFQFQGQAAFNTAKQIKIESFNDLVAINALARPGPLDSGGTELWIKRRNGLWPVETIHPIIGTITEETYGVIIYQEQVMRIAREFGGLSWPETIKLRKAIGKSQGDEINKLKDAFIEGAWKANKIKREVAEAVWNIVQTFGSYGFNKSHAVAYSVIAYWCAWLKAQYPLEFAAASLDAESDPDKQILFLRELDAEGIGYVPIDPDKSSERWEIADGKLIGPLSVARGIGPAAVAEILEARKEGKEIRAALRKRIENGTTDIDSIFPIRDAIDTLLPDPYAAGIQTKVVKIKDLRQGDNGAVVILGMTDKIAVVDMNDPERVLQRGYKVKEPSLALNVFLRDDEDKIFCRVQPKEFARLKPIFDEATTLPAYFAIKGTVPPKAGFRMLTVHNVKFLGVK